MEGELDRLSMAWVEILDRAPFKIATLDGDSLAMATAHAVWLN